MCHRLSNIKCRLPPPNYSAQLNRQYDFCTSQPQKFHVALNSAATPANTKTSPTAREAKIMDDFFEFFRVMFGILALIFGVCAMPILIGSLPILAEFTLKSIYSIGVLASNIIETIPPEDYSNIIIEAIDLTKFLAFLYFIAKVLVPLILRFGAAVERNL